ncbi:MAG: hypothetical protein GQ532_12660 [Methylomarinum sp.]|nr:hypothetical protein [Methylomarinum sp.]
MTSLSALFSLLGILFYIKGRLSPPTNKSYTLIFLSLFICTPLTVLSKENGLLLPYFLLLIEFVFFRFNSPNKKLSVTLRYGSMLLIAIPVLIASYNYSHIINWVVGGYSTRDFTLTERLLTESRVVCFYLRLIFLPNINLMGIFHDDIALSSSLFSPANTLFSCLFILGLLISAIALIRKAPIFSFGILFFFLGHSIESSFLSLEITHEHRNYLPLFGLVFMFCYYLTILLETIPKNYKYIIISTLIIFLSGNTVLRASQWGNQLLLSLTEVKNHPNSYRANHELSRVYQILANHKTTNSHQYEKQSLTYATKAYKLKPNKPGALLNLIHHSYLSHQPVSNDLYIQLYKLLKNRAITNKVTYTVSSFVDCTISKKCHPSSEQINTLLNTVLNASLINKDNKAKTIINLAKLAATENNHRLSIAYLIRATEISNRFETHYLLTTTLIDFKFFDKALKQIMFMKTQNYNSANFKRLTILKQKLKLTHTNK